MMKAGTETGSLLNHLFSAGSKLTPQVGMGATILCWTDRHAVTIIKVTAKTLVVQYDKAIRTDSNGMSEAQHYEYERDENGMTRKFCLTSRGWREAGGRGKGNSLLIGQRVHYHDYSF